MKKGLPITVILLIVFVATGFFGMSKNSNGNNENASSTSLSENSSTSVKVADFRVDLGALYYTPAEIKVKAGTTFTIQLVGTEGVHDFAIDELNVKSRMLFAGEEQIISITIPADASGKTYQFYCTIEGHRDAGMSGNIVVE